MTQGTTPDFTIYLNNKNIKYEDILIVYVTLKQGNTEITHNSDENYVTIVPSDKCVTLRMDEAETLMFKEGEAELQVRVKYKNNNVFASAVKRVPVDRVLNKEVI